MSWVHPTLVANTQGTGMGGMMSMRSLYVDTLLGESKANDILQEALPNVVAAHVVQSHIGSYGSMIHPVAACATAAVSVEEGADKIRLGKALFAVAGGFDDLGIEGIVGFGDMSATADSAAMAARGIDERRYSRANDRRRGGFVESQGGGTVLLARGDVAAQMGLPVLGVVAFAQSFGDGVHTSIPAPGIGALGAARGASSPRWPGRCASWASVPTTSRWCPSTTPRPRRTTPTSPSCTSTSPVRSGAATAPRCSSSRRGADRPRQGRCRGLPAHRPVPGPRVGQHSAQPEPGLRR